jgi:hypothetical protein
MPDDDPNMDRNIQQTLNKTNVSTVLLNWFVCKFAHCDTQQDTDNKDNNLEFLFLRLLEAGSEHSLLCGFVDDL